ncbi:MAG: D-isomer specific 2-hydroxyacid dehydrogenase family protein [Actinomycetota bacterium]
MNDAFVPGIAVVPWADDEMLEAVAAGGGKVVDAADADGLVWTDPRDAEALKQTLSSSTARWVQLPFAGIEAFVGAGAIDPTRTWTCAKGIYGHACAEQALALMLAAARRIHHHLRATTWRAPGLGSPERRLKGATVLVVGAGGIGRALIQMVEPLGATVQAINRSGSPVPGADVTATLDRFHELLAGADFVAITAALTAATRGMFDRRAFEAMKDDAWLVNVARGGLVVTQDLVDALRSNTIGGAALDVTDPEPLPDGHSLWGLDNVIITPHIANTWDMALPELRELIGRNVARFAAGQELEGLVDPALGY